MRKTACLSLTLMLVASLLVACAVVSQARRHRKRIRPRRCSRCCFCRGGRYLNGCLLRHCSRQTTERHAQSLPGYASSSSSPDRFLFE